MNINNIKGHTLDSLATELGFSLESGEPRAAMHEWGDTSWPCVEFTVTLKRKEKAVIVTTYSKGVGHIDPRVVRHYLDNAAEPVANTMRGRGYDLSLKFIDKKDTDRQLEIIQMLAKKAKMRPSLEEVLASLVQDGQADIQAMRLDDWCAEYGYNSDSIKASETFNKCCEIGRKLRQHCDTKELEYLYQLACEL